MTPMCMINKFLTLVTSSTLRLYGYVAQTEIALHMRIRNATNKTVRYLSWNDTILKDHMIQCI
jgi:hypothetical protein